MLRLLKSEPVATMAIITAATGVAVILGASEAFCGSVAVLIGTILAFPVRNSVSPVGNVVSTTKAAAQDAARQVASVLTEQTAGKAGSITDTAERLVATAADGAADAALRQLGVSREDRAK